MKYTSRRMSKKAPIALALLILLIFALAFFSLINALPPGTFQTLMLIVAVITVKLIQRYILTSYEYILDPIEEITEKNRISIITAMGQRRTVSLIVPLSNLTAVLGPDKKFDISESYGEVSERFDFCPDLAPSSCYLLIFEVNGKISTIKIQCDSAFAEEIRKRAGV